MFPVAGKDLKANEELDVPTNTELLGVVLGQEFDVVQATSGPEAIDIAQGGNIDLVLLDIIMPGMDGYDVCRALKADPVTADIPVIFITAMSEEEDEEAGLAIGAIDYVPAHRAGQSAKSSSVQSPGRCA